MSVLTEKNLKNDLRKQPRGVIPANTEIYAKLPLF